MKNYPKYCETIDPAVNEILENLHTSCYSSKQNNKTSKNGFIYYINNFVFRIIKICKYSYFNVNVENNNSPYKYHSVVNRHKNSLRYTV